MDLFYISDFQSLEDFFLKPNSPKQPKHLPDLPRFKKKNLFTRIKSNLGVKKRLENDYARFLDWLDKERISAEEAMSIIKESRGILKEAR